MVEALLNVMATLVVRPVSPAWGVLAAMVVARTLGRSGRSRAREAAGEVEGASAVADGDAVRAAHLEDAAGVEVDRAGGVALGTEQEGVGIGGAAGGEGEGAVAAVADAEGGLGVEDRVGAGHVDRA